MKRKPSAIKRSVSGIGTKLSDRADKVADILLDKGDEEGRDKAKKIKNETVSMLKDVAGQFRENIKELKPGEFLNDAAYGIGRITGMARKAGMKIADLFTE